MLAQNPGGESKRLLPLLAGSHACELRRISEQFAFSLILQRPLYDVLFDPAW